MSECACIYDGDSDGPEFSTWDHVKARKPHTCCECRRVIAAGEFYARDSGKWDGEMIAFKTCLECEEIRAALCCDGFTYGLLWENAKEQVFPTMKIGCINSLETAAAKQKLMDAWREWLEAR